MPAIPCMARASSEQPAQHHDRRWNWCRQCHIFRSLEPCLRWARRRTSTESDVPCGAIDGRRRGKETNWSRPGTHTIDDKSANWKQLSVIASISFLNFYFRFWGACQRTGVRLVPHDVESLGGHLVLERLPAYVPELSPVEYFWGYLKQRELPNLCLHTIGQVGT